ncbi:MATE family efflux transporter [Clostridium oryzae]|uniref:Probable multidrug resistance protein NorM n=1 Tax=Clostridium oryzae TaxID=1450648 RepID=A0A1V4IHM7_9CLOT|nr:MATE family efflux transporter [Clostridium oryzae]OPJ59508.1 multidrug resistance protein MdtK [Clostridium oryzae]
MLNIRKDVLRLTVPILMEQIFVMAMGAVNTIMSSNVGKQVVSAIGMVDSINNIFIAFFSSLAVGGTVVVAQYTGKGDKRQANNSMKQALFSSLLVSFIITLLIFIFRRPMINLLFGNAEKAVIDNALRYMEITLLTYPLISIELVSNGILRGIGDTKTPMKITIIMNIINVVFSYIFIYGINISNVHFTIHTPPMGITGAAIGIALARTSGAVIVLMILVRGTGLLKLNKIRTFRFDKELLKSIFGIGVPAGVESLMFNGGKLITQIYIVSMGTNALTANTISGSIAGMLNIPGNALCTAATTMVGHSMGKGKDKKAEDDLSYIVKLSTISLITLAVITAPFVGVLSTLYTRDPDIIKICRNVLLSNALFMPVWSISFVLPSGLKGAGDAKYTMITAIIGMWVFRITLGYLLGIPLKLGLVGVWVGMYIDWTVRGILYLIRFKKGKWKKNVVIRA